MSQGFQSALAIDTQSPLRYGYDFMSCGVKATSTNVDASGIRGTRSRFAARVAQGEISVAGPIVLEPSFLDLKQIIPLAFGGTPSGDNYPLADNLSSFYICHDKVAQVMTYAGCVIGKMTLTGREGMPVEMSLEIVGQTESVDDSGTFPTVTYNNQQAFMFFDSLLTVLDTARQVRNWTLTLDNMLEVAFYNSQTATSITPRDRLVSFECQNPYTADDTDLYQELVAGAVASLVLTDALGNSVEFDFAALQVPPISPEVNGRELIPIQLQGISRATVSGSTITRELVAILTPAS